MLFYLNEFQKRLMLCDTSSSSMTFQRYVCPNTCMQKKKIGSGTLPKVTTVEPFRLGENIKKPILDPLDYTYIVVVSNQKTVLI